MYKIIMSSNGYPIKVDSSKYDFISKWKWYCTVKNGKPVSIKRVTRISKIIRVIYFADLVIGRRKGYWVDHINRDPLDNRRKNLRFVTPSQNLRNSTKRKGTTSIYKGVWFDSRSKKWKSTFIYNKKIITVGTFDCEHKAALAYNKEYKKYFKKYMVPNKVPKDALK